MRVRFVEGLILLAVMLVCVPSRAGAQTVTGTIQGTVADSTGSVLPGVAIQIKNQDTGATRDLTTNVQGFYSATFLPVGRYSVTAKLTGFGSVVRDGVDVGLNQTRVADFQMKPATREETVTVTGAAPPINTVNAEVKGALDAQQIADKPTLNPAASCRWPRSSPAIRKSDQRPEQSDGLLRVVHQFQRNGHARRHVSNQRGQQRRFVREPAPPGRGAVHHQGIPDSDQYLQRGVWPRLRRGRPGADKVGHQSVEWRRLRSSCRTATT
jgi:hypothetical protein